MNRPSAFSYLIGNPVSVLGVLGFGGVIIYRWWMGQAPILAALISFMVIGSAMGASDRISSYAAWKRQWDALGGIRTLTLRQRIASVPGLRAVVWLGLWMGAAYYENTTSVVIEQLACLPFLIGLPLLVLYVTLARLKHWLLRRRAQRLKPVAVRLPRARRSPTRSRASAAVPEYCRRLIENP